MRETAVTDRHEPKLKRLRSLSRLLDDAVRIPWTQYRVGLDPLIGLIPGGGDLVAGILSAYIIVEAARMGIPKEKLGRMGGNVLLEIGVGAIPLLGDLFDVTWKANARNVALLEEHLAVDADSKGSSPWLVAALIVVILGAVAATTALAIWLVRSLLEMNAGLGS